MKSLIKILRSNSSLSGGERQHLFILLALIPNPELVFLDELTTGLGAKARRDVWENKNTWFFPVILGKLAFDYGINFEYRIVGWQNCEKTEKCKCHCLYSVFPYADFFGRDTSF